MSDRLCYSVLSPSTHDTMCLRRISCWWSICECLNHSPPYNWYDSVWPIVPMTVPVSAYVRPWGRPLNWRWMWPTWAPQTASMRRPVCGWKEISALRHRLAGWMRWGQTRNSPSVWNHCDWRIECICRGFITIEMLDMLMITLTDNRMGTLLCYFWLNMVSICPESTSWWRCRR